ncbi:MAG TPA: sulfotransferase [Alphaproteobacteria bacterium]|jgi:hypothetical protein
MDSINQSDLASLLPSASALERMVYLVGPARGGTTIMHMAMDVHPNALVLPGVTHFLQQIWRYRRVVHERLLRLILRSAECWHQDAILARLDAEQNAEFIRLVNAAFATRALAPLYKLYPIAYALSPKFAKAPADIACWHDKSNDWRYFGVLAEAFPQARFIFVVRDPRSVAVSGALRMSLKAGEARARAEPSDLVDMALYWRLMVQRCLDFAHRHPARSRIVRFEDFLAAPVATLAQLFRFTLGHAPPEADIERGLARTIGRASNDPAGLYRGISREPVERWKTALAADDVALVERLTAPTARKVGYDMERHGGIAAALGAIRALGSGPRARWAAKLLIEEGYEARARRPAPPTLVAPGGPAGAS